jgi:non-lysosomal glucosylceramidase
LHNVRNWDQRICSWQSQSLSCHSFGGEDNSDFYRHQLFNELYFLVDGGTVWTDTNAGLQNPLSAIAAG